MFSQTDKQILFPPRVSVHPVMFVSVCGAEMTSASLE